MFVPMKSDTGAVLPWEYLPAVAGEYKAGQLLDVADGKLTAVAGASTETPPYLSMGDIAVTADELVPVTRSSYDYIYETQLSAAAPDAAIGTLLQVSAGGLEADATASGTFEIVSLDGTEQGDYVRGRWI